VVGSSFNWHVGATVGEDHEMHIFGGVVRDEARTVSHTCATPGRGTAARFPVVGLPTTTDYARQERSTAGGNWHRAVSISAMRVRLLVCRTLQLDRRGCIDARREVHMSLPRIGTREEWLAARRALQRDEDEATALVARVSEQRRSLPMVPVEKPYRFEGPDGELTLLDLFDGRRTLLVYSFMFDPSWDQGCRYCSFNVDSIPHLAHLHARDVSLVLVSRAPMSKIAPFKERMGWNIPWVSSGDSAFNQDFYATLDGTTDPALYMYRDRADLDASGDYYFTEGDQGGSHVFVRDGERVFHTYTTYTGDGDLLNGIYGRLDLTPFGREPDHIRYHDRY
jgi:predicted dithiol-disulfide oxidoreductase (DUF899 family)